MVEEKMSVEKIYKKKRKKLLRAAAGEEEKEESDDWTRSAGGQEEERAGMKTIQSNSSVEVEVAAAMSDSGNMEGRKKVKLERKNSKKKKKAKAAPEETPTPASTAIAVPSGGRVEGSSSSRSEEVMGEDATGSKSAAPAGMQIYWTLSAVDGVLREEAAGALVKELAQAQIDYENNQSGQEERAAEAVILGDTKAEEVGLQACAPAVQYALRRLIRGVASSREGARQGFSLALASVLGTLKCVSSAAVLKMVDKHLELTSSMKGQEARDALLGQLFAFGALIRSPLVGGDAGIPEQVAFVRDLTERLLTIGSKKTFLLEAAIYVLAELGEKLDDSVVEQGICAVPMVSEVLQGHAENISPDYLFLSLRLSTKLRSSTIRSWSVIPDSGNLTDIFERSHLLLLAPCLKESTKSHPRVHAVWEPLIQVLFSDSMQLDSTSKKSGSKGKKKRNAGLGIGARLSTFWSTVVDESLLMSSHERKHLALELVLKFLPRLANPVHVQFILSKSMVQCLLDAGAAKDNFLYKAAKNCIAEVCKWAEEDDERRVRVVIALQQGSQGKFDQTSKTQSVRGLVNGLSSISGYQSIFKSLLNIYLSVESGEDGRLTSLTKKQKLMKESEPTEINYTQDETTNKDALQRNWAVDHLRGLCQQALVAFPANVVVEELIIKFVSLLKPPRPFTKEDEQAVSILQSAMTQVSNSVSQAGERKDRLQAMLSLLVQLLFESRLNPRIAVENASEIAICCKKAFGGLQLDISSEDISSEEGDEEPAFMDVLVDVLLSLLAQSSAPIRSAADQVFKSFSSDLTSSGLSDLLRIVKKNTQRSRHKPVVEVDSNDAADDEDILDLEDSDEMSEDENGDVDEVDNDDDAIDLKEGAPAAESKGSQRTRERDGSTAAEGNESEDEEVEEDDEDVDDDEAAGSDLDDEAMFKMDKHLAGILKQRKQGSGLGTNDSKDAQTQLLHFKFRVLSLLDYFVQKHSNSILVLTILPSLLHVYVNSCTTDGHAQIADRVRSILQNKLFKGKEYPRGPEVDQEILKGLLKRTLKLASRSTVKGISTVAQAACHWLLKVIYGNLEQGKDTEVEEMLSGALDSFFVHKKCRLPSVFFKDVCIRNSSLGQSLLGDFLERSKTARSECLRFEAIQLAGTIMGFKNGKCSRKSKQQASDASTQLMGVYLEPHIPSMRSVIIHLLKAAPSIKSARRIEALQFSVSSLELFRALYPGRLSAELLPTDNLASVVKEVSAPPKSKLANLLEKLQQLGD